MANNALTEQQALELAGSYKKLAADLADFRLRNWASLEDEEKDELKDRETELLNYSEEFINLTAELILDDLDEVLDEIRQATKKADEIVEQINDIGRAIKIAASVVNLGGAIAAKDPSSIIKAVKELTDLLKGDGKKKVP